MSICPEGSGTTQGSPKSRSGSPGLFGGVSRKRPVPGASRGRLGGVSWRPASRGRPGRPGRPRHMSQGPGTPVTGRPRDAPARPGRSGTPFFGCFGTAAAFSESVPVGFSGTVVHFHEDVVLGSNPFFMNFWLRQASWGRDSIGARQKRIGRGIRALQL